MSQFTTVATIAGMTGGFFAGGVLLKEYNLSDRTVHLVMSFCFYGLGNCLLLMVINQSGLARAMVVSSCAQIALTCLVAILWYREALTFTQGLGIAFALSAAVLVMNPSSSAIH